MKRDEIKITDNKAKSTQSKWIKTFSTTKGEEVRKYHASFALHLD